MKNRSILIGIVEVSSKEDSNDIDLLPGHQAFAKVIVMTEKTSEFNELLENRLKQMGLVLVGSDEVRILTGDEAKQHKEKLALLDDLNRIVFLTFHTFDPNQDR